MGIMKIPNGPVYSAAKSLTATFVGIAQEEGHLDINNKTSDYLGANWSQLTTEQQDMITVKAPFEHV